ncbi:helix-turn-helix domain-containing protein [Posidoniimonas corsicana]|uniref:helix-turn-helix domain-containing protein n=1 Tax=Posidoniimonas corsicana TaxID=1938618 RepID=UPI0011B6D05E
MRPYLTPNDVAKQLGVSTSHVSRLIASGQISATNVAVNGARRPTYRIDPADVDAFLTKALAPSNSSATTTRRRRSQPGVSAFF